MIKDALGIIGQYRMAIPCWDGVIAVLEKMDAGTLEQGRHEIPDSPCFYIVSSYETREYREDLYEFHKNYIDIQVVLEGEEIIYTVPLERVAPDDKGYNAQNDIQFGISSDPDALSLKAGEFAVLYPGDAHMPGCKVGSAPVNVKKLVIKVPAA